MDSAHVDLIGREAAMGEQANSFFSPAVEALDWVGQDLQAVVS
jgi:hypothetical protein